MAPWGLTRIVSLALAVLLAAATPAVPAANCPLPGLPPSTADADADGVPDYCDNCVDLPNPQQEDADADGAGNRCDGDIDNSGFVNYLDLGFLSAAYAVYDARADFDSSAGIDNDDLVIFRGLFGTLPGPTARTLDLTNTAPEVATSVPATVLTREAVVLDASGSTDADLDQLEFKWSLSGLPADSASVLTGAETATAGLVPDREGPYQLQVAVSDASATTYGNFSLEAFDPLFCSGVFLDNPLGENVIEIAGTGFGHAGVTATLDGAPATILERTPERLVLEMPAALPTAVVLDRAEDSRSALCDSIAMSPLANTDIFIAVDGAGNLVEDGRVGVGPDDTTLDGFLFRPDGELNLGMRSGLELYFPAGARLVERNGEYFIQFEAVTIKRGAYDTEPVELAFGVTQEISVDRLDADGIRTLMGLAPGDPLPIYLTPSLTLDWRGGTIDRNGTETALFVPVTTQLGGLPFADTPVTVTPVKRAGSEEPLYMIAYYGLFSMNGVTLEIPRQRPWAFIFHADGKVELSGEARFSMPNGASFRGSVEFLDGRITIDIGARKLHFDALASLAELMPPDPGACVPTQADDQQMNIGADCLEAFTRSYQHFAVGAVQLDEIDFERDLVPLVTPETTVLDAYEAMAWRAFAQVSANGIPGLTQPFVDQLAILTDNAAKALQAEYTLPDAVAWNNALLRLKAAVESGNGGFTGDFLDLNARRTEAEQAVIDAITYRLNTANDEELLASLQEIARAILDGEAARQAAGVDTTGGVWLTLSDYLTAFSAEYLTVRLGVVPGEDDPVLNDRVLGLDRNTSLVVIRNLLELMASMQSLGYDWTTQTDPVLPFDNAITQLLTHLEDLQVQELTTTGGAFRTNPELLKILMRDRLELAANMAQLGFEDEAEQHVARASVLMDWEAFQAEIQSKPGYSGIRIDWFIETLEFLDYLLDRIPPGTTEYPGIELSDIDHVIEEFIKRAPFDTSTEPRDWVTFLRGGIRGDRIGRNHLTSIFAIDPAGDAHLIRLVRGLVTLSGGDAGSTNAPQFAHLDEAARLLQREIAELENEITDQALSPEERDARRAVRLSYLQALGELAMGYQRVAQRLYAQGAASFGSLAFVQDLLLPGDIRVHEIAAGASLDIMSGQFSGRFSGKLEMPKFSTLLTVQNASFDSFGTFDIAAFGQTSFPGQPQGGSQTVTLVIPERRAVKISVRPGGSFSVAGGADLRLPDGTVIGGYLSIEDPEYVFELSFGGKIRLDLINEMSLAYPVLNINSAEFNNLSVEASRQLASFYTSFGLSLEGVLKDLPLPPDNLPLPPIAVGDPGEPPEFTTPVTTIPLQSLDAMLTGFVNEEVITRFNGVSGMVQGLRDHLGTMAEEINEAGLSLQPRLQNIEILRERAQVLSSARASLDIAAASQMLGGPDRDELVLRAAELADKNADLALQYVESLTPDSTPQMRLAAMTAAIDAVATAQEMGSVKYETYVFDFVQPQINNIATFYLEQAGLSLDSTVVDEDKFKNTSDMELLAISKLQIELAGDLGAAGFGDDSGDYAVAAVETLHLLRERKLAEYQKLSGRHDIDAVLERSKAVAWLFSITDELSGVTGEAFDITNGTFVLPSGVELVIAENGLYLSDTMQEFQNQAGATGMDATDAQGFAVELFAIDLFNIDEKEQAACKLKLEWLGQSKDKGECTEDRSDDGTYADNSVNLDYFFTKKIELGFFDVLGKNLELLLENGLLDPTNEQVIKEGVKGWATVYAQAVETKYGQEPIIQQNQIEPVYETMQTLMYGIGFLGALLPEEEFLIQEWTALWQDLHVPWIGAAEAQKALWYIGAYANNIAFLSVTYELSLSVETRLAFEAAARDGVASMQSIVAIMSQALASVDTESFTLKLPGDLQVERFFGRLEFNRDTGEWQVAFGGSVRFPEIDVAFSVVNATLASNGDFSMDLATSGPVPLDLLGFGIKEDFDLDIDNGFTLSGNLLNGTINSASVEVTLMRRTPEGDLETYSTTLQYQYSPGDDIAAAKHQFGFDASIAGGVFNFSDDLRIFHSGLAFDLVVEDDNGVWLPQQGSIAIDAQAGIMAATDPMPVVPTINDFHLVFEGKVELVSTQESTEVRLGNGNLKLPKGYQEKNCDPAIQPPGLPPTPGARKNIAFTGDNKPPLIITYNNTAGTLDIAVDGTFAINDVGFGIGSVDALWVDVCSLELQFAFDSNVGRPKATLAKLDGRVSLAVPGDNLVIGLQTQDWTLDGLPTEGRVFLAENLTLFSAGDSGNEFKLEAMAPVTLPTQQQRENCANNIGFCGTYIELFEHTDGNTGFKVSGEFKAQANGWFKDQAGNSTTLSPENGNAEGRIAGDFSIVPPADPRDLTLDNFVDVNLNFAFSATGEFYIGESDGTALAIIDPRLEFINPLYMFRPTVDKPFELNFDLGLAIRTGVGSVSVQAERMRLVFDGTASQPLVGLGAVGGCVTLPPDSTSLVEGLPFYLEQLCIAFKNENPGELVPLFATLSGDVPAFGTDNIAITLSAGMVLPPQGPEFARGDLSNAIVDLANGFPTIQLDGVGLGFDATEYLGEKIPIGGQVFIGGLQTGDYYFSGVAKVNIKGNAYEGIIALDTEGLRGFCFGLAGADVSIPIAYGFVMTGAKGGLALGDGAVDPCDFVSLMKINPVTGAPDPDGFTPPADPEPPQACPGSVATIDELQQIRADSLNQADVELDVARSTLARRLISEQDVDSQAALAQVKTYDKPAIDAENQALDDAAVNNTVICPSRGSCPPASLGILAQPHPEAHLDGPYKDRAIYKFTSIDETTLNLWGFDRDLIAGFVNGLGINFNTDLAQRQQVSAEIAEGLRAFIDASTPKPESITPEPEWVTQFYEELDKAKDGMQLGFYNALNCGFGTVATAGNTNKDGQTNTDDVIDAIYWFVRDTAYAGVEYKDLTFRLEGSFSYAGISSFASITGGAIMSTSGSTGIVGSINVLGIPTGKLTAFTNQTDATGTPSPSVCGSLEMAIGPLQIGSAEMLADCPGCTNNFFNSINSLGTALNYDTRLYFDSLIISVAPDVYDPNLDVPTQLSLLSDAQKQRLLGEALTRPPSDATPFHDFLVDLGNSLTPRLAACGEVRPNIFGFTPAGDNVVFGTRNYFGPVDTNDPAQGFRTLSEFRLSPLQLIGKTLLVAAGPFIDFIPSIDQAAVGIHFKTDSLGTVLDDALTLPPQEFLDARITTFIDSATMTMEYELSPLGMELGRSGGRLLFPSYSAHPAKPGVNWTRPETRGLPSRLELLGAMLGDLETPNPVNVLADPLWEGSTAELDALFPQGAYNFTGTKLVDDFFPHGGFIGASTVSIPKLLSQGIDGMCQINVDGSDKSCLGVMLDGTEDPLVRLDAASGFFGAAGSSETVSRLGFYIPAPNPPQVLAGGFPEDLQDLFNSFSTFDATNQAALYPIEEAFVSAESDLTILGLPTARTRLNLNLDLQSPNNGLFEFIAQVPDDSWLAALATGLPTRPCLEDPLSDCATVLLTMESGAQAIDTVANTTAQLRDEAQLLADSAPEVIEDFLAQAADAIASQLPRGMLRIPPDPADPGLDFTLPLPSFFGSGVTDWSAFTQNDAGLTLTNVILAAYTPRYDPTHTGTTLFDTIVRDGGIGLTGSMDLNQGGLQLTGATGSMVVTPQTDATGLPTFQGEFTASSFSLDGVTPVTASNIDVTVAASANSLDIATSVDVSSLAFGDATLKPTTTLGTFNVSGSLTADAATGFGNAAFEIGPALLTHPAFGRDTRVVVDLNLATNQPWTTTATIESPEFVFDVNGETWLSVTFPVPPARPLTADISGNGAQITSINIGSLPTGAEVRTFPGSGDAREQTITVGTNGTASLSFGVNGNFQLNASGSSSVVLAGFPGATMSSGYDLEVSNTGFQMSGTINRLLIPGLAGLMPQSGDADGLLDITVSGNLAGVITATLEPAALDLSTPVVQSEILIDGGTYLVGKEVRIADLSISTGGDWDARVSVNTLSLDPDGSGVIPAFLQVSAQRPDPFTPAPALFTLTANFNGLSDFSFSANRSGALEMTLLPGTDIERSMNGINPGNQSISFDSIAGFDFSLGGISPSGWASAFSMGSLPGGVTLFEVSSGGSSSLEVNDNGLRMVLGVPSVSIAGIPLLTGIGMTYEFEVSNSGAFSAIMRNSVPTNLFGPILQLDVGTHTLSGAIDSLFTSLSLTAKGKVELVVPIGSGVSLFEYPFDLNLNSGQIYYDVLNPGFSDGIDLNWVKVQPRADGRIQLGYGNGAFAVGLLDWDVYLFDRWISNNVLDFTLATNGRINLPLPQSTFDFGALIRLDSVVDIPFAWDLINGEVDIDLPGETMLTLPGFDLVSGVFVSGLNLANAIDPSKNTGIFDYTWGRTVTINGSNFGSINVRLRRLLAGTMIFNTSKLFTAGDLAGLEMETYVSSAGTSRLKLIGSLEVPIPFGIRELLDWVNADLDGPDRDNNIELGSLNLDIQPSSTTEQFRGTASILGEKFTVVLGTDQSYIEPNNATWARLPLPTLP